MLEVDVDQVGHIARLAVLGMCVRGVAAAAFEASDQFDSVHISVKRAELPGGSLDVSLEYGNGEGFVVYGASL
jgi:hypothetical protein